MRRVMMWTACIMCLVYRYQSGGWQKRRQQWEHPASVSLLFGGQWDHQKEAGKRSSALSRQTSCSSCLFPSLSVELVPWADALLWWRAHDDVKSSSDATFWWGLEPSDDYWLPEFPDIITTDFSNFSAVFRKCHVDSRVRLSGFTSSSRTAKLRACYWSLWASISSPAKWVSK